MSGRHRVRLPSAIGTLYGEHGTFHGGDEAVLNDKELAAYGGTPIRGRANQARGTSASLTHDVPPDDDSLSPESPPVDADESSEETEEHDVGPEEPCPKRRRHHVFMRRGEPCPECGYGS